MRKTSICISANLKIDYLRNIYDNSPKLVNYVDMLEFKIKKVGNA